MPGPPDEQMIGDMALGSCPVCDGTPRVLVAIRHPVMRRYAAELLARECGCWASSDVTAGEMLPEAIDRLRPDLLVVDAGDFPACCQAAIDAFPRDRVVVVGPEPDPSYGVAALADGAAACIARDDVGEELIPTMRAILGCRHEHCPPDARQRGRVVAAAGEPA
jgi:DNA-binding NarL/FixJ family response regulator